MELTYAGKMMVAGHRGDQSGYPENTMEAFRAAIAAGVDMIETDVRLTKDGALVLIHDKTVDRTTDGTGAVAEMTLAQLRTLNAGTVDRPQPIPLLEELLALEPQVVVTSGMAHYEELASLLEANGVQVVGTDADSIAEVYEAIRLLGAVMGKNAEAEAIVADMQVTFDEIAAKSEATGKTIYFEVMPLEWGLWSAGNGTFMQELAQICGMQNAFADIEGWQSISQEQVIERDPDYIVLVTGMGESAPDEVKARNGWGDLKAVRNDAIYNADSYMLTRPAPRLKDAAIELYNFLYQN